MKLTFGTLFTDDNFEWNSGAAVRFGLQYLNYTSLERTPKASLFQLLDWYKRHGGEFLPDAESGGIGN